MAKTTKVLQTSYSTGESTFNVQIPYAKDTYSSEDLKDVGSFVLSLRPEVGNFPMKAAEIIVTNYTDLTIPSGNIDNY